MDEFPGGGIVDGMVVVAIVVLFGGGVLPFGVGVLPFGVGVTDIRQMARIMKNFKNMVKIMNL